MRLARMINQNGAAVYAEEIRPGSYQRLEGDLLAGTLQQTGEAILPAAFLPPLEPRAILCIGLNYKEHIEEGGAPVPEYPVMFMKNPAAATAHQAPIQLPAVCADEVDYEAELAVIIKAPAKNVSKADALNYVLGYTTANDVSARIWQQQKGGSQWNRGKSFDTFAPLGPILVTADELTDPNSLAICSRLNGEEVQRSNTANMLFDVPTLIAFLSQDTTLLPGTVLLTGTPQGVGWARDPKKLLRSGDTIEVEIEGIGVLHNPVE